jgi:hypothetical protein
LCDDWLWCSGARHGTPTLRVVLLAAALLVC